MSSDNLLSREQILAPRHEALVCPDAGEIQIFPYVSGGALDEFLSAQNNPRAAFAKLYAESITENGPSFDSLTEADCDAIAAMMAESVDVVEDYRKQRSSAGVFDSFAAAFLKSDVVQKHNEHFEDLERYFRRIALPSLWQFERTIQQIRPLWIPTIDLDRYARDITAYQAFADSLVNRLGALDTITTSFNERMATWNSFSKVHTSIAHLREFDSGLAAMAKQIERVQKILTPVTGIHDALIDLTEQLERTSKFSDDMLRLADRTLAASRSVVLGTNDHFINSTYLRPLAAVMPETVPSSAASAYAEASDSALASDVLLHEETSELIVVGAGAVDLIAQAVDEKFSERMRPFQPLLDHLQKLSQPPSFINMLKAFAQHVARDHWKSLWTAPGDAWLPQPERIGQSFLGIYLQGQWAGIAFVGREIACGDGYVDLLVNFLGKTYIVELKMIGAGWGIGEAKKGLQQLNEYMSMYSQPEAYLMMFDGRKTMVGEQLDAQYTLQNGTAHVIRVAVYADAPSK
jgi:hypothetical protein